MADRVKLTKAMRAVLTALSDPCERVYLGGFDLSAAFALERAKLVEAVTDPMFPNHISYRITPAGRTLLASEKRG